VGPPSRHKNHQGQHRLAQSRKHVTTLIRKLSYDKHPRGRAVRQKLDWEGRVTSIQPRIRLLRSFDQRSHRYLGYVLRVDGVIGAQSGVYSVAVGKGAHAKHAFQVGDLVRGVCLPVADSRRETAEYYKVSGLKVLERSLVAWSPPPWHGSPSELETYRTRGHRRLDVRTYKAKCASCVWGCLMPVEIVIDQWNPSQVRHREETFCYGPKSCPFYRPGSTRKVPGRQGMVWEEEDWVDEEATAHRGVDD